MDESLAAAVDVMRANGIAHRLLTVLRQQGEIESESASAERPALSSAYAQMHASPWRAAECGEFRAD